MPASTGTTRIPALALIGGDGQIERTTESFRLRNEGNGDLGEQSVQIASVLSGQADAAAVTWSGVSAEVEAVVDSEGARHALLMVPSEASSAQPSERNAVLDEPLDDSPAIVWLKDLEGRYLRVNSRFVELLGTSEDQVRGQTDNDLPRRETIDGPRLQKLGDAVDEPLQFEYIVPAFENRPVLSVLRFAVRDQQGAPVALCSVAAPLAEADVAREETVRLMEIESSGWLDPAALRTELLKKWGVRSVAPETTPAKRGRSKSSRGDRAPAESDNERDAALAEADAARTEAEHAHAEAEQARDRAEALQSDVQKSLARAERAEAEAEEFRAAVDQVRAEADQRQAAADEAVATAVGERDAALTATEELAHELEQARARLADLGQEREADESELKRRLDQARAEADEAREEAKAEIEQLKARLEQAHAEAEQAQAEAHEERDAALTAKQELATELEQAQARLADLDKEREADESELQRRLDEARVQADEAREEAKAEVEQLKAELEQSRSAAEQAQAQAEQQHAAAEREVAAAVAERASASAANAELEIELEQHREQIAALSEELSARAERVGELDRALESERARNTELDRERVETQQRAEDLERQHGARDSDQEQEVAAARAQADEAQAKADATKTEAEQARARTAELERELEQLRDELRQVREQAEQDEAESARGQQEDGSGEAATPAPAPMPRQEGASSAVGWPASAQREFSAGLQSASEWMAGLEGAVKVLGSHGGWDAVTAWLRNDHGALRCGATWIADKDLSEFETLTWQTREAATRSILARALPAPTPTWVAPIELDGQEDPRLAKAAQHGMRAALLVPVRDDVAPIALIELLTRGPAQPDHELSDALEAVALQLGHFAHLLALGAKPHWQLGRL